MVKRGESCVWLPFISLLQVVARGYSLARSEPVPHACITRRGFSAQKQNPEGQTPQRFHQGQSDPLFSFCFSTGGMWGDPKSGGPTHVHPARRDYKSKTIGHSKTRYQSSLEPWLQWRHVAMARRKAVPPHMYTPQDVGIRPNPWSPLPPVDHTLVYNTLKHIPRHIDPPETTR